MLATTPQAPGLIRRLAALFYDALLITALWMMLGGLLVYLNSNQIIDAPILPLLLPLLIAVFYSHFWRKSGQTLGMQTWKIQIVSDLGAPITIQQCMLRLLGATVSWLSCGLGFVWMLIDKEGLTWHDRWSKTRLIQL